MRAPKVNADTRTLLDPTHSVWKDAPEHSFDLVPTPLPLQPSPWIQGAFEKEKWGQLSKAGLRMVHNGQMIAARLEWAVAVPSMSTKSPDEFADACAVMFPFVKNAPILMGAENQWVNMWLWRGDGYGPFAVTAAGIGTSQRVDDGVLKANAHHGDGRWQVAFVRPIAPVPDRDHVPLKAGMRWQVTVALWHGAARERAGLKSFSPTWADLEISE